MGLSVCRNTAIKTCCQRSKLSPPNAPKARHGEIEDERSAAILPSLQGELVTCQKGIPSVSRKENLL